MNRHQSPGCAEILCVGTELLLGQVVNSNAAYLGAELAKLGIPVYRHTVVGDNRERLIQALSEVAQRCDLVVLSGGLGPTDDDITREAVAEHLGLRLVESEAALTDLRAFLARFGRDVSAKNRKQALLPEGARMIPNKNGTAPACMVEQSGVTYLLLPGPPAELRAICADYLGPLLGASSDAAFESRVIRVSGIGESQLETAIQDLVDTQTNPTVAVYAGYGEASVRLTASGMKNPKIRDDLAHLDAEIRRRLGDHVYGSDDDSLEAVVLQHLRKRGYRLALAESCTGGALGARLISVSGASRVIDESIVAYSNDAKTRRLGVPQSLIQTHGAVSEECARAMAQGVAATAGVEAAIAVTGIAGPEGGTPGKPVGTVYIAVSLPSGCTVRRYELPGDRDKVRRFSVSFALECLRRRLLSEESTTFSG